MFLLFDIELLYLFAIVLKNFILEKVFWIIWIFSFLLIISYLYEILKGSLKWYDGFAQQALKKNLSLLRYFNK
jgi:NADH:ubiquinone oxidoreductase subunit 3 (subunit A)